MKKFILNKYIPIVKSPEGYIFGLNGTYSSVKSDIKIFNTKQEDLFAQLIDGNSINESQIIHIFGDVLYTFFIRNQILIELDVDVDSIYSRSKSYYFFNQMGNVQQKLKTKEVLILGCGGIGTHLAWNMTVLGVKRLILVDFDIIEEHNLNRQILFDTSDIGKQKIEVLKEKLSKINSEVEIVTINMKICSEADLDEIVSNYNLHLIIKSLDSPTTFPIWLDNVCEKRRVPYISGITLSTSPMIGPTFLPGVTAKYSDFFDLNDNDYTRISGISQSISPIMYYISGELALEAFKLLSEKGSLKYTNCIYTEDVINRERIKLIPKYITLEQEDEKIVYNLLTLLLMMCVFIIVLLTNFTPLILMNYIICISSPFIIYRSIDKISRTGFLNTMVIFPITILTIIFKTDFLLINNTPNILTLIISLLVSFSVYIIIIQILINLIYNILRRLKFDYRKQHFKEIRK